MPASRPPFAFDAAAFAVEKPCGDQQAFYITRYPPPSPVTTSVVRAVVAPPAVVVLG